jgi:type IV secretion system protein VirB6/type IV secretion system protein TrbL
MKDSALERIGQTTGGKIAAAIKTRDLAAKAPGFGDDSLSAAAESADPESEVAAFRNRS